MGFLTQRERRSIVEHLHHRADELKRRPTIPEQLLCVELNKRLPKRCNCFLKGGLIRFQVPVIWQYVADFYCSKAGVVFEIDGPSHERRQAEDAIRDAKLLQRGCITVRFTNAEVVEDPGRIAEFMISLVCARRPRTRQDIQDLFDREFFEDMENTPCGCG